MQGSTGLRGIASGPITQNGGQGSPKTDSSHLALGLGTNFNLIRGGGGGLPLSLEKPAVLQKLRKAAACGEESLQVWGKIINCSAICRKVWRTNN